MNAGCQIDGASSGKSFAYGSYLINRFAGVFCARNLSHDDAPTAQRMHASRGNAPGTCPSRNSALKAWRFPAPFQGAPINTETQCVALGWSAAAPSAPKSKDVQIRILESYGWPFTRWLGHIEILLYPVVVVARVFRRGGFLVIGKQTLASKEASYNFAAAGKRKASLHAGYQHRQMASGLSELTTKADEPPLRFPRRGSVLLPARNS